jgi:methyl-accepting chemotaxis protein
MVHEGVLTVFVIVTSLAVVIQAAILFAMFQALRQLRQAVIRIDTRIKENFHPFLRSITSVADAVREPVRVLLSNLADISGLLRQRSEAADAVAGELLDRFRAQALHADELLTTTLEKAQAAVDTVERGVLAPVRELSALLAGVRRGLEFFLGRRRPRTGERARQEEELFI